MAVWAQEGLILAGMPRSTEAQALRLLAKAMGVHSRYKDGLGRHVTVAPETLVRVCAALGAAVTGPGDAAEALRAHRAGHRRSALASVLVAWDGILPPVRVASRARAEIRLEGGATLPLENAPALPPGYHALTVERPGGVETSTIISAPMQAYSRPGAHRSWGVGTQLAALRSARSRSLGDIRDLESVCRWVRRRGGDLVTVLPLLPTFNDEPAEPSPYSPVSRLFWSELVLDLGPGDGVGAALVAALPVGRPQGSPLLDVRIAAEEIRQALANSPAPDASRLDAELVRYARFRGAQARLGRNWRAWPGDARSGTLPAEFVDEGVERFHLVAQTMARRQLADLRGRLDGSGVRLGLDLAVGVHSDGYDPWSRQSLFADGMSVGAPPDAGFPSGQDWGFAPVLPGASRAEGHRYIAASIAHQASLAGVLRIDHIMAWTRLYWIPHGFSLHQGTYVSYPADELFAVLTLESNRNRCEIVGENLGTVPREIDEALPRHRIPGMYLAQFEAPCGPAIRPPGAASMALIGTHDTPTFTGWIAASDVDERVRYGLLDAGRAPPERAARARAVHWLADALKANVDAPYDFLAALLEWLGRSESPLVVPWLEDLWLEERAVNLPGTRSSDRPNWQRPMRRLLDDVFTDPQVDGLLRRLHRARSTT